MVRKYGKAQKIWVSSRVVRKVYTSLVLASIFLMPLSYAESLQITGAPFNLSGRVNMVFSGTWADTCTPNTPLYTAVTPTGIRFFLGYIFGYETSGACDFSFTPYDFELTDLNIPVNSGLSAGGIDVEVGWYVFGQVIPTVQTSTEIRLQHHTEQYVYLAMANQNMEIRRRSDFGLVKGFYYPGLYDIQSYDGRQFFPVYTLRQHRTVGLFDSISLKIVSGWAQGDHPDDPAWFSVLHDDQQEFPIAVIESVEYGPQDNPRYAVCGGFDYQCLDSANDPLDRVDQIDANVENGLVVLSQPTLDRLLVLSMADFGEQNLIENIPGPGLLKHSLDGQYLLVYSPAALELILIDMSTRAVIANFSAPAEILGIAADASKPSFYVWDAANRVRLIDADGQQVSATADFQQPIAGLSVNPEGGELLVYTQLATQTQIDVLESIGLTVMETHAIPGTVIAAAPFVSERYWSTLAGLSATPVPANSTVSLIIMALSIALSAVLFRRRKRVVARRR